MANFETLAPQKISNILKKNGYFPFKYGYSRYSSKSGMTYTDMVGKTVCGGDFKCTKCTPTEVKVSVNKDHRLSFETPCTKYEDMAELLRKEGYEVCTNGGRCYFYVRKPIEE